MNLRNISLIAMSAACDECNHIRARFIATQEREGRIHQHAGEFLFAEPLGTSWRGYDKDGHEVLAGSIEELAPKVRRAPFARGLFDLRRGQCSACFQAFRSFDEGDA